MTTDEPGIVIDVPGCTCGERTQEQLDRADVCPACVSYFDLAPRVTKRSHHRGHPIYLDEASQLWRYEDGDAAVRDCWKTKDCGRCEKPFTEAGHDPCIANLPGVRNACCGHGVDADAYVEFDDWRRKTGDEAVRFFEGLRADG